MIVRLRCQVFVDSKRQLHGRISLIKSPVVNLPILRSLLAVLLCILDTPMSSLGYLWCIEDRMCASMVVVMAESFLRDILHTLDRFRYQIPRLAHDGASHCLVSMVTTMASIIVVQVILQPYVIGFHKLPRSVRHFPILLLILFVFSFIQMLQWNCWPFYPL